MKVTYHPYKEVTLDKAASADEELLAMRGRRAKEILRKKYSFVTMCYHPARKIIIVGATHSLGDILLTFNPRTRRFSSCGFQRSRFYSAVSTKIHKGLSLDVEKDEVYFGIATLSGLESVIGGPGGP